MRVTEGLIFQNARTNAARASEAAERAQQVAASQTKLVHPGDDPGAAGTVTSTSITEERYTAIGTAATAASSELSSADSSLSSVSTALSQAKALAVQFSSSGYTDAQATGAASQVSGIISQIVSALNLRVGDRYVFGGTKDSTQPFDADGNYSGDANARMIETAPGVLEQSNVDVATYINGANGGTDVFKALDALKTALSSGADPDAVKTTLDGLDQSISQVAQARTQAGTQMSVFDAAASAATTVATDAKTTVSNLSDADIIDSSIQLQATQTALQATLSATAQSFKLSLLNYLS